MKNNLIFTSNDQDYLAEKFRIEDNHVCSASKIALLKIQSWKFAAKTPEIGPSYFQSISEIINRSFFNYVPASHILSEEAFYFNPNEN